MQTAHIALRGVDIVVVVSGKPGVVPNTRPGGGGGRRRIDDRWISMSHHVEVDDLEGEIHNY